VRAVVLAAGQGRRLRPLTERWPKPVLPIDGRPLIGSLARELAAAGFAEATVVTGHLAERVEELLGDGSAFGLELCYVRQPRPDGSADAVRCAVEAGVAPPLLVVGADKLFRPGDLGRFADTFAASGAPAALAFAEGETIPLWGLTEEVTRRLPGLPGPPHELLMAVEGLEVAEIQIGKTRDLTDPLDLVRENFPYLR
jgi:NDP-sugar pyrophosphorylase family protein